MFWYIVFGGLWILAFIGAYNYFIIASAVCTWYFYKQESDEF